MSTVSEFPYSQYTYLRTDVGELPQQYYWVMTRLSDSAEIAESMFWLPGYTVVGGETAYLLVRPIAVADDEWEEAKA